MVLGLFTGLLYPGGIERVARHVGAVLASYAKERGETCQLLSLNDPMGVHDVELGGVHFSVEGFNREKAKFFSKVARFALSARIVYVGHANIAPFNFLFRLFHCRTIVASHGVDVWGAVRWWRRLGLRLADRVTAPSTFTAEKLVSVQGIKPDSVALLPWALDPGFQFITTKEKLKKRNLPPGKILLTVSRLATRDQYKGVDTVIQALQNVRETFSDVYYIILGDGDDRPRLEQIAKDSGVDDCVFFKGTVSDRELHEYFQDCDVFVMPSEGEGFGLVFIEAMAFGKPVVGGRHAGPLDIIVDGETGLLVECGDVPGLTQCLLHLLKDQSLRNRMGEAGRRRVRELYTFNRFKQELVAMLNGEQN
jgi:glycosyltransferase involved in cell wall biosynthesis